MVPAFHLQLLQVDWILPPKKLQKQQKESAYSLQEQQRKHSNNGGGSNSNNSSGGGSNSNSNSNDSSGSSSNIEGKLEQQKLVELPKGVEWLSSTVICDEVNTTYSTNINPVTLWNCLHQGLKGLPRRGQRPVLPDTVEDALGEVIETFVALAVAWMKVKPDHQMLVQKLTACITNGVIPTPQTDSVSLFKRLQPKFASAVLEVSNQNLQMEEHHFAQLNHIVAHEVTLLPNGSVDLTADPMMTKLLDLEVCNNTAVNYLLEYGLKGEAFAVKAPQNKEKEKIPSTQPGSNKQTLKISKAKTAGQKFCISCGFVTNSKDIWKLKVLKEPMKLIAERKTRKAQAAAFVKKKGAAEALARSTTLEAMKETLLGKAMSEKLDKCVQIIKEATPEMLEITDLDDGNKVQLYFSPTVISGKEDCDDDNDSNDDNDGKNFICIAFLYNDYRSWLNTTKSVRLRKKFTDSKSGNKEGWSTQGPILYKYVVILEIELIKTYQQQNGKHTLQDDKDKESKKEEQRQKEQECDMIATLGKDDKDYKFYVKYMKSLPK
eukprot:jgi/Psemu1/9438/gm1.9438_g